jgi:uncharacterized membrane protein
MKALIAINKLKTISPWFSILATLALSAALILTHYGIDITTQLSNALVVICTTLTAAGILTAPKPCKEISETNNNKEDSAG